MFQGWKLQLIIALWTLWGAYIGYVAALGGYSPLIPTAIIVTTILIVAPIVYRISDKASTKLANEIIKRRARRK